MSSRNGIDFLRKNIHLDIEEKLKVIANLDKCEDVKTLKHLSQHFSDGHPKIRETLYKLFSSKRDPQVAEIVADTLHSPQLSVRSLAMEILRELGSQAVSPLNRIAKSQKIELRKIAADLLGDIHEESSSQTLINLLNDKNEEVVSSAIESLGKHKEIRAIPQLLNLYQKSRIHQPIILNALGKIFLHWEKYIIRTELFDADPILAASLVNTVQENGNASTLTLMIHWLQKNKFEMGDEIIKAIAAILNSNPNLVLPIRIIKLLIHEWQKNTENLPLEAYLTCISRIPSNRSFHILSKFYQDFPSDGIVKAIMIDFIGRFQTIFFNLYFQLPLKTRLNLINLMIDEKIMVFEIQLLHIYSEAKNKIERQALLELAVKNKMPEAKQLLLARLSENSNTQVEQTLHYLSFYHDESLWPLYLNYYHKPVLEIKKSAARGLSSYPKKTLLLLQEYSSDPKIADYLFLAMMLPVKLGNYFFETWLTPPLKNKINILKKYLIESNETRYLPLITRILLDYPKEMDQLFSALVVSKVKPVVSADIRDYWLRWPDSIQKATIIFLQKYWKTEFEGLCDCLKNERDLSKTEKQIATFEIK
jgi:hypothetical protein